MLANLEKIYREARCRAFDADPPCVLFEDFERRQLLRRDGRRGDGCQLLECLPATVAKRLSVGTGVVSYERMS